MPISLSCGFWYYFLLDSDRTVGRIRDQNRWLGAQQLAASSNSEDWKAIVTKYKLTFPTSGAHNIVNMLRIDHGLKVSECVSSCIIYLVPFG